MAPFQAPLICSSINTAVVLDLSNEHHDPELLVLVSILDIDSVILRDCLHLNVVQEASHH